MAGQPGLQPFHAMEILARAKALEAGGRPIYHMELGEPGVPPAPAVLEAVQAALPAGQFYTPAKGLMSLRRKLSRFYQDRYGISPDPDAMIVTMGSSAGFILAFHAAFRPGDAIAVTRPGYPGSLNTIAGLGFRPIEIGLSEKNGWRLTAASVEDAYRREPFKGLLLASPANPTGATASRDELAAIVSACKELGVTLISDEIYHGLDYSGSSVSVLELTDDAIVVNSFSKYFCMTGWRVGWIVLPEALQRRAEMLQQNFFISAASLSQVAAEAALDAIDYCETQKQNYATNRATLVDGLARLGFDLAVPPVGAFYAYADVSRFTNDSLRFAASLLDASGVATAPGIDFDREDGNRYLRLSYAGSEATISAALERIGAFVEGPLIADRRSE